MGSEEKNKTQYVFLVYEMSNHKDQYVADPHKSLDFETVAKTQWDFFVFFLPASTIVFW